MARSATTSGAPAASRGCPDADVNGAGERDVSEALRERGVAPDAIEHAVARGDPVSAIFDAVLLPAIGERTVSAAEIEAAGGLSSAELVAIMEACGLPGLDPSRPASTPEEARVYIELAELRDIWPVHLGLQLARVYGRQLSSIAQTEVQPFRGYVEPRVSGQAEDRLEGLRALEQALALSLIHI